MEGLQTSVRLLQQAIAARRAHDYPLSVRLLRQACVCDPCHPDALFALGFFARDYSAFERGYAMGHGPCAAHMWAKLIVCRHNDNVIDVAAFHAANNAYKVACESGNDYALVYVNSRTNSTEEWAEMVHRCITQEVPYILECGGIVMSLPLHPALNDMTAIWERGAAVGLSNCQYLYANALEKYGRIVYAAIWHERAARQFHFPAMKRYGEMVLMTYSDTLCGYRARAVELLCLRARMLPLFTSFIEFVKQAVMQARNTELYQYGRVFCEMDESLGLFTETPEVLMQNDEYLIQTNRNAALEVIRVFHATNERCRRACCVILALPQRMRVGRDVAALLARAVWQTRQEWA